MTTRCATTHCTNTPLPRRKRGAWLFIVVSLIALVSIIGGESWAIRQAPALDASAGSAGSAGSMVAADLNRTLARVAEASLLIGAGN